MSWGVTKIMAQEMETNFVANQPPDPSLTGMPIACANYKDHNFQIKNYLSTQYPPD